MKRRIAFMLTTVFAAAALLAGCGQQPAQEEAAGATSQESAAEASTDAEATTAESESDTPTLDRIKSEGVLKIGTSPDYPPFEFLDENDQIVGFDIDLMREVAKELGVELEVVSMDFGALIAALNAEKFDIMAAGVTITEERLEQVDFTTPYLVGSDAIVVHQDWTKPVEDLEDLKGHSVAVQIGTVQADAAHAVEGIEVKEYNLFTDAAMAVASKQADALYLHTVVGQAFVNANSKLKIVAETPAKDTAFAVRKDTPDLTEYVNEVLAAMQEDGRFETLVKKWFK